MNLTRMLAPEDVKPMVDRARAHDLDLTDPQNPTEKDSGPASVTYAQPIALEITNAYARRYVEALGRVMPQALGLYNAAFAKASSDPTRKPDAPPPKVLPLDDMAQLVPVHPVDSQVIRAIWNLQDSIPFDAILLANPTLAKAPVVASIPEPKLQFKADDGLYHWVAASDPSATAADVAKALFTSVTGQDVREEAYRLIAVPPLFGFHAQDLKLFKGEHFQALRAQWASSVQSSAANPTPAQWPADLVIVLGGVPILPAFRPSEQDPMTELTGRGAQQRALAQVAGAPEATEPHDAVEVVSRLKEVIKVLDGAMKMIELVQHDTSPVLTVRTELEARQNDARSTTTCSADPATMYALADRQAKVLATIASSLNEASVKFISYGADKPEGAGARKLIDEAVEPLVDAIAVLDFPEVATQRAALGIQRARDLDISIQEMNLHAGLGALDASLRADDKTRGDTQADKEQKASNQFGYDLATIRLQQQSNPAGATGDLLATSPKINDLEFDITLGEKLVRLRDRECISRPVNRLGCEA